VFFIVEIRYNEKPHIFGFLFNVKEYMSEKLFDANTKMESLELSYFLDLLTRNKMLSPDTKGTPMIWSTHYNCSYRGISFILVYDEDYGFVSFAVDNPKHRIKIAELIKNLIENKM